MINSEKQLFSANVVSDTSDGLRATAIDNLHLLILAYNKV